MARVDYTNLRKTRHTLTTNLRLFAVVALFCLPGILLAEETQTLTAPSDSIILPKESASEKSSSEDRVFKEFCVRIKELLAEEALLVDANEKNRKSIISLFKLKKPEEKKTKKTRKEIKKGLNCLEKDLARLTDNWKKLDFPDKKFFPLRDTKLLRLSTFRLHIEDKKRIINTWDPTDIEYAIEHLKQSNMFEEKFRKILSENSIFPKEEKVDIKETPSPPVQH